MRDIAIYSLAAPLAHSTHATHAASVSLTRLSPLAIAGIVVAAIVLLILLIQLVRLFRTLRAFRAAGSEGRRVSATQTGDHPTTNFTRDGKPSDPLNVRIASSSAQLGAAFAAAGWYRADEIDLVTSWRISIDSIFGRKYATAPVSNLYLYGRRQDYAFERPGKSVRERDHVRFWDTGQHGADGRAIWLGGATKDIKVEISKITHLPTHKIAPDTDAERAIVMEDLVATGWVTDEDWAPGFGKPTQTHNGLGDPYYTDGEVACMTLANVFALPFATQVRSPLGARITQTFAKGLRWRLPKSGKQRAKLRKQRVTVAAPSAPATPSTSTPPDES